ncbi:TMCO1/EMC3 family protein, partial [Candidatus Woesearchaeota archaeon]|nr:TMCO1/EMC3 family protein [Candidatus Woesearchaeota archaeon]
VTDQNLMKTLKTDMKKMQKEMKEMKQQPEKIASHQKILMKKNMEYMKHSMKPTLITMLPVLLLVGWLATHIAFAPIVPRQTFTATLDFVPGMTGDVELTADGLQIIGDTMKTIENDKVKFELKGEKEGVYILEFEHNNDIYEKKVRITKKQLYEQPTKTIKKSDLKMITLDNAVLRPFGDNFNIAGWHPGWLSTYIILSFISSILIRKFMRVY